VVRVVLYVLLQEHNRSLASKLGKMNAIMTSSSTLWKVSISCCIAAMLAASPRTVLAQESKTDHAKQLSAFDVVWNEPGKGAADSMPLGTGEIGLNVWTEFPAFWERGHDYMPDEDNGGNGENGLQEMLMQTNGRQITLLPAWPKNWNAEFKLHAPYETTVEGRVVNGKLVDLKVTPDANRTSRLQVRKRLAGSIDRGHGPDRDPVSPISQGTVWADRQGNEGKSS
jgi:hypothetical protein